MSKIPTEGSLMAMFETGHEALKAEKLLKQANIPLRMMPAPPELSTGCALGVQFAAEARTAVETVLTEADLPIKHIFCRQGDTWTAA